jgi:hypothetical protein
MIRRHTLADYFSLDTLAAYLAREIEPGESETAVAP